ncbi:hypothetical protein HD806DRAFT_514787 [Xylariaceae sp. AK1471]|nr:hypothetical protein HD806DRAFT_514787 [Xylariaceae sp. AK1471]
MGFPPNARHQVWILRLAFRNRFCVYGQAYHEGRRNELTKSLVHVSFPMIDAWMLGTCFVVITKSPRRISVRRKGLLLDIESGALC